MRLALYSLTILLFCLLHFPSFCILYSHHQTHPSYRICHMYSGLALYLLTFMVLSTILSDFLRLIIPPQFFFVLWCLPASLLFLFPHHLTSTKQPGYQLAAISHSSITSTVTFLLSHCGEATALLLLLSLYTAQDIPLFIFAGFGSFLSMAASRIPMLKNFVQSRLFYFLQYFIYLLISILFLYVYPIII